MMVKSICIVLSGSVTPGKEVAVQSIVRQAAANNIEAYGAHGFVGILDKNLHPLNLKNMLDFAMQKAAYRCTEIENPAAIDRAVHICRNLMGIDMLIIIGGNGSLRCAQDLERGRMDCIFIPATAHNDVGCTDYCIGFDSALNAASSLVEQLAASENTFPLTCFLLEVPGHAPFAAGFGYLLENMLGMPNFLTPAGDIQIGALERFLHGNLDALDFKSVFAVATKQQFKEKCAALEDLKQRQANYSFQQISLAPFLRGGRTSAYDQLMARMMAEQAFKLVLSDQPNRAIGIAGRKVSSYTFEDALELAPRIHWPYIM